MDVIRGARHVLGEGLFGLDEERTLVEAGACLDFGDFVVEVGAGYTTARGADLPRVTGTVFMLRGQVPLRPEAHSQVVEKLPARRLVRLPYGAVVTADVIRRVAEGPIKG